MQNLITLAVFMLLVTMVAVFSGQVADTDWYVHVMKQPSWSPPVVLMAAVSAVLYILMALAGWMVWESTYAQARFALVWWCLQLLLNMAWSWMFFELHRIGWALPVMALWLFTVFFTIRAFRAINVQASHLMIPVAVWLLFLLVLGTTQWVINGGGSHTVFQ